MTVGTGTNITKVVIEDDARNPMTEILRCPLVPNAEPDVTGIGDRWHVYAVDGPDWLVDGPERSTPAEAIAVWNEAMRGLQTAESPKRQAKEQATALVAAGDKLDAVISAAQQILTDYLTPQGPAADRTISRLLGLFDGRWQRTARGAWRAAKEDTK